MNRTLKWLFALTVHFCILPLAGAVDLVPLKAFFGKPILGTVALSPSGQFLAVTVPGKDGKIELRVTDLDIKPWNFKTIAWLTDFDINGVEWLNDKRLIFNAFDSQAGAWAGTTGLWAVDVDGENPKLLIDAKYAGYQKAATKSQNVLPGEWHVFKLLSDYSDDILISKWQHSSLLNMNYISLARLNTRIPDPQILSTGAPDGVQTFVTNKQGLPEYAVANIDKHEKIYQKSAEGKWTEIANFRDVGNVGWRPRFLIDDSLFISAQTTGANASQLLIFNPETKAPYSTSVLSASGFDVGDNAEAIIDHATGHVIGWRYRLDTTYTRWIEEKMAHIQTAVDSALPNRVNTIECNRCSTAKRWMIVSTSDRQPPNFYLFEKATGEISSIGTSRPGIVVEEMGNRSFQRIKARDGEDLPVYVTRPEHIQEGKAQPTVVYVHGGPWSRVGLEWPGDVTAQFLASRGYVVIEPEFRGSQGYGAQHMDAGNHQWGLKMQDDLSDALQWAIHQGIADKDRVCIMGASYGGYAALMGPIHDPTAYRCAISFVGVTDIPALLKNDRSNWGSDALGIRDEILRTGDVDNELEKLKQTSPVYRAADIHVPVLAAWGKDDRRVPLEQGRDFRAAAEKAGVKLEYVEYPGEGHSWLLPETKYDFYGRVEKFLGKNIGSTP